MLTLQHYTEIIRALDWFTAGEWAEILNTTRSTIYSDKITTVVDAENARGWWFKHPADNGQRDARYTCVRVADVEAVLAEHHDAERFSPTSNDRFYSASERCSYVSPAGVIAWGGNENEQTYAVSADEARKVAERMAIYSALVDELAWSPVSDAQSLDPIVDISYSSIYRSARELDKVRSTRTGQTWRFVRRDGNPLTVAGYNVEMSEARITGPLAEAIGTLRDEQIHALADAMFKRGTWFIRKKRKQPFTATVDGQQIEYEAPDEVEVEGITPPELDTKAIDDIKRELQPGEMRAHDSYVRREANMATAAELANLRERVGKLERTTDAIARMSTAMLQFTRAANQLAELLEADNE